MCWYWWYSMARCTSKQVWKPCNNVNVRSFKKCLIQIIYSATSAVLHVVLEQFKTCIILLGNYYLFGSNPGIISICGAFAAIAGMSVYTYLNLKQQSNKIFPRQATLLPKSKLSKENGTSQNWHYSDENV